MSTTILEPRPLIGTPPRTSPDHASTDANDARPIPESREIDATAPLEEPDPYRTVLCCGRDASRP